MIHSCIDELFYSALDELKYEGDLINSRNGKCYELLGYEATLQTPYWPFLRNSRRKLSPYYACAEILWYFSFRQEINMIRAYAPQYEKFAEHGKAFGAYGDRWLSNTGYQYNQIKTVINLLEDSPNTRQAIITMWNATDLIHTIRKGHKDLPCTISMQFLLRGGLLNCITTMRSNDVWLGLPYDIFAFTFIQRVIAEALHVNPGFYKHQVGSLHLYEKNFKAADEIQLEPQKSHPPMWGGTISKVNSDIVKIANAATTRELMGRLGVSQVPHCLPDLFRDLVVACNHKWHPKSDINCIPKVLKEAIENANS